MRPDWMDDLERTLSRGVSELSARRPFRSMARAFRFWADALRVKLSEFRFREEDGSEGVGGFETDFPVYEDVLQE